MIAPALPRALFAVVAAILLCGVVAAIASGKARSVKIEPDLCETTGGGRFVGIPGFPGEMVDRRLKRDVKLLVRRYKLHITDGYSLDPVHSRRGEHPIGLALDIVPDSSRGGTWRDVTRLARWAEPRPDQPRAPFRWVGYDGDPHHGRGHHLHLSWAHSETRYNRPARTVYTLRCPAGKGGGKGGSDGPAGGSPPEDPAAGAKGKNRKPGRSGGLTPGKAGGKVTGGVGAASAKRSIRAQQDRPGSRESGGIGLG